MKNQTAINLRKSYKEGLLTKQQYKTLKGQVLEGKERAAVKGLARTTDSTFFKAIVTL